MIEYSILQFAGIEFPFNITYGTHKIDFPLHTHNFTELTIIINGCADHIVEGKENFIGKGEVYVILPSFVHGLRNVKNLQFYNIMFDLDKLILLDNELKKLPGFQALFILEPYHRYYRNYTSRLVLNDEQLAYVISICRNIENEYLKRENGYKVVIKTYFLSLITYISRHLIPDKESISEQYYKIAETLTFIEENYKQKITLHQLAQMAFLSERQYSRVFKSVYNTSPINYVINCRLKHACDLMRKTQLPLKQIAEKCGFLDNISFCKLFKQRYLMTPSQYRKS